MTIPESSLLQGRTAMITGAASGIGRAVAAHYLAAGARVVVADLSPRAAEIAGELGADGGVVLDATDEDAVDAAVAAATEMLGRIDVLVTSHGILTQSPMVDMSLALWQETLSVDLTSVFLLNRAVLPGMLGQGGGRIVNVASQLGIKGGESLAHYAAAKAGVIAMTKSLALEVSSRGVLVNAIAPGPIETPMLDGIDDEWKRAKRAELPLGRFGTADEVAPTAVLLASDPGGNLFVGQVLGPNSGDVMP
ncbi:3-oxoacyl-ACP reductase [Mycolicibacterium arabiense]|uniref:3-oxoacyl-ACP reductase n=1 Tax=Mycolicibacterium arabiense TaxID=1286181 RepID=A0A7I7S0Z1_9MYCO|nr:SDR family NAD(P)-dependent oxidoreductase [Mycolicibacterium arabiense]MCV7371409.1 SDR family oxidoreductase [Mycolicibacterium arabiense]BBY50110.1 3-oxoacyl-ACP reductase [Mycolicibacterium arabiense]